MGQYRTPKYVLEPGSDPFLFFREWIRFKLTQRREKKSKIQSVLLNHSFRFLKSTPQMSWAEYPSSCRLPRKLWQIRRPGGVCDYPGSLSDRGSVGRGPRGSVAVRKSKKVGINGLKGVGPSAWWTAEERTCQQVVIDTRQSEDKREQLDDQKVNSWWN